MEGRVVFRPFGEGQSLEEGLKPLLVPPPVIHKRDQCVFLASVGSSGLCQNQNVPVSPAKIICLALCLTDSEAITSTASTQLAINWRPELD